MSDELRERLIVRILRMPLDLLPKVEHALDDLQEQHRKAEIIKGTSDPTSNAPAALNQDWAHAPLHRLSDRSVENRR
jgi:hypothetical protein